MGISIELGGSRAMVTGGGQGVGRGISLMLASAGATVVVNDYVAERAESVVEEIRQAGNDAVAATFDVTDFQAAVDGVTNAGGSIDILVNNAGNAGVSGFNFAPFHESVPADWQRYFDVNLYGVMNCTRSVLPDMVDRNYGRIVTIISDAGRWGEARMGAYSAAKAGAAGFTRSLARDVGRYGITVNNVAIATIDTTGTLNDLATMSALEAEDRKKRLRNYIVRRFGTPEDIAAMVTFLVSPLSPWITGQTYPVNGGYTVNQ